MYSKLIEQKQRQAGRRYEYYVAQLLRKDGWTVEETGRLGTDDHGIDLIATKDGVTRYVQCKGWSRWKTISENVVSQLYGSVAMQAGPENVRNVEMYLYSPAQLTDYAQREADKLGIRFIRLGFARWRRR